MTHVAFQRLPHLSLARVYAALAYYEDHRQEMDSLKVEEATFIADMRRSKPPYLDDDTSSPADGTSAAGRRNCAVLP